MWELVPYRGETAESDWVRARRAGRFYFAVDRLAVGEVYSLGLTVAGGEACLNVRVPGGLETALPFGLCRGAAVAVADASLYAPWGAVTNLNQVV